MPIELLRCSIAYIAHALCAIYSAAIDNLSQLRISIRGHARSGCAPSSGSPRDNDATLNARAPTACPSSFSLIKELELPCSRGDTLAGVGNSRASFCMKP